MKKIQISRKNLHLILILFTINLVLSDSSNNQFLMEIKINQEILKPLYIQINDLCDNWIPSLLTPILLVSPGVNPKKEFLLNVVTIKKIRSYFLRLNLDEFSVTLFNYTFLNEFHTLYGKPSNDIFSECYMGLSSGDCFYDELSDEKIFLDQLKKNKEIKNKIFSIDKWKITDNLIQTYLYFGYSHENFKLNKKNGIIGRCKTDNSDPFWGCYFDKMAFNGNETVLKNDTHKFKIYFSSENHEILFPKSFENNFNNLTGNKCTYESSHYEEEDYYLTCDNFFMDNKNTTQIDLINENMIITVEIDNLAKYRTNVEIKKQTRIRFEDIDFFIFPLIMFKQFHIEFNKEEQLIKFYTEDNSILKILKQEEKKGNSSVGLKIFLSILIISLILVIGFGAFWFIKKRRASVEKNINKYNKFDEDENFQNMNQKVF